MEIFDYVLPVGRVFDEFLSEKKVKFYKFHLV